VSGWATVLDQTRQPEPSIKGETAVIESALQHAGWTPADIDYVNPHGSGSIIGDEIELQALAACGLAHAAINTTKSLVGHGLSAAGVVEVIATVVQMERGSLHPCRNLDVPIDPDRVWIGPRAEPRDVDRAITLSLGFGGLNTAICLSHLR
jgi:malonyl-ACP decarboxylase